MSLFKAIHDLDLNQLQSIANVLDLKVDALDKRGVCQKIQMCLIDFTESQRGERLYESHEVLDLWKEYAYQIIDKRRVKDENKARKQTILRHLSSLNSRDKLTCSDTTESVVRDILLLLWEEASKKDQQKFRDVVRQELDKHNVKFTDKEFDKTIRDLLIGGVGGAVPFAVPMVAGLMLQQLTQGFMAWIAVNLLGQKALQVAALGMLAGPFAWGIAIGGFGIGAIASIFKFKSERRKFRFIQAILSIYAYKYQNRFNSRREATSP